MGLLLFVNEPKKMSLSVLRNVNFVSFDWMKEFPQVLIPTCLYRNQNSGLSSHDTYLRRFFKILRFSDLEYSPYFVYRTTETGITSWSVYTSSVF